MDCILCGSADFTSIYTNKYLVIVRCTNCGLTRQQDYTKSLSALQGNIKDVAGYYQKREIIVESELKFSTRKVVLTSDIREEIANYIVPKGSVLDVGCGRGELLIKLQESEFYVTGLEPNPSLASFVQDKEGIPVVAQMYSTSSFSPNTFDAVTFIQVMEHLENPLDSLYAAFTHLKPGGLLVVDVPSINNPRILAYRICRWKRLVRKDFIAPHCYYYSRRTLSLLVEKAGFTITKVNTGRYRIKSGMNNVAITLVDKVANTFGIGGITLYAKKPFEKNYQENT